MIVSAKDVITLSAEDLLKAVKVSGNLTGDHQDDTLAFYIDEVKEYLRSAGVERAVIDSTLAKGCISRGVFDLWMAEGGGAKFSEAFYQRAIQLERIEVQSE